MGLGIDYVLFLYEDRNFCKKKAYLWKITDEMKQAVLKKINTVNTACKTGVPPEKNEDKCTYCKYKNECGLVDAGKWVHPNPPVKPKTAKKSPKKSSTGKSKGTKKTGQKSPKTASTDADILAEALNLDDLQESCGLRYLKYRIDGLEQFILDFCAMVKTTLWKEYELLQDQDEE